MQRTRGRWSVTTPGIADLGVAALRAAYQAGRCTPVEVVEEILDRIRARGEDHVWINRMPDDELLRWAAEADIDAPLGGIPFAVKDNIDVAGLPTTAACPDFSYQPRTSAVAVQRLVDAGALVIGKTNLDQFATGLVGTRSPYGACESVYGGGLISGGSSSGSAVAVAAGLCSFSLGTDTAGSGRVPAALNGIVGVKPTRGLLSTVGVVPACRSLDCVSVFAGTVADATTVAELAAGPPVGAWDRAAPGPLSAAALSAAGVGGLRLGVPDLDELDFSGDEPMRAAFAAAVARAAALVGTVVPVRLGPFLEAGDLLYRDALVAERLADLGDFLARRPDSVLPVTRQIIEGGARYDAAELFRAQHRLRELNAWAAEVFTGIDALLLPTVPTTFTIAEVQREPIRHNLTLGRYTQFVNLLDLAAVAVPAGSTVDGRPAGVSVIGPAFSDATLAALATALAVSPGLPGQLAPPRTEAIVPANAAASVGASAFGGGPEPSGPSDRTASAPSSGAVQLSDPALPDPTLPGPALPGPALPDLTAGPQPDNHGDGLVIAVVGKHLRGEPKHHELSTRGAVFHGACLTAPLYRLYHLPSGLPGLVRVTDGGAAIEVELWRLPLETVGGFLDGVGAPLSIGRIRLDDGAEPAGFLCEAYAAAGAQDITRHGGWRAYLAATTPAASESSAPGTPVS